MVNENRMDHILLSFKSKNQNGSGAVVIPEVPKSELTDEVEDFLEKIHFSRNGVMKDFVGREITLICDTDKENPDTWLVIGTLGIWTLMKNKKTNKLELWIIGPTLWSTLPKSN